MINIPSGIFKMEEHGCCGYIKKTERVSIKDIDEHNIATVICSSGGKDRVDLIPYRDLREVKDTLPY